MKFNISKFTIPKAISRLLSLRGILFLVGFLTLTVCNNYMVSILKGFIGFDKINGSIKLGPILVRKYFFFAILLTILGMIFYSAIPFEKELNKIFFKQN